MEMEKKNVAIIILAIALVASGVGNIIFALQPAPPPPEGNVFLRATGAGPHTIDPINSWDSASNDVLMQVCEGLFEYDYTDVNMPRVNRLAESFHYIDTTHVQIKAKEGIFFHDGTEFDADAIKWNLERISYLTNGTGTLPSDMVAAEPASLYWLPNGTGLIKSVTKDSKYNVTVELAGAYGPFIDLLCYAGSYMISPTAHPKDDYIPLDGVVVGTGPYTYEYYISNVEVRFSRWDNYWRTPVHFDEMVFVIIQDSTTRNNAMLGHEVDYLAGVIPSLIETFEADPETIVKHFTDDTGIPGLSYYMLGMNNKLINLTWRKAISFAVNYTYIVEVIGNNLVFRANSPISPGYAAAYNASVKAADYDLAYARSIVKSMFPVETAALTADNSTTGTNANGWKALTLNAFNYTYNSDNSVRADIGVALAGWLDQIGVTVVDDGITWDEYLTRLFAKHDLLGIFWIGWGPDYLDPFNMLDPLFNPLSSSNFAQVDDPKLNQWMEDALTAATDTERNNIYKKIQWYLANVIYAHCYGYHPMITSVHGANIHDVAYNAQGNFYAYPIWRSDSTYPES